MRLKELRKTTDKTQEELAKELNIQKQTYQNYELEKRTPDIPMLIKIADYFRVSVDYLIEHEQVNKLDMTSLSDIKKDCIKKIQSMTDDEVKAVSHFIAGLTQQEFILNKRI